METRMFEHMHISHTAVHMFTFVVGEQIGSELVNGCNECVNVVVPPKRYVNQRDSRARAQLAQPT